MSASNVVAKGILFFLNFLFVGLGIALLTFGVIGLLALKRLEDQEFAKYQTIPFVLIGVGVIVFFIAFMGCCGTVANSNCTLAIYAIFKVILMILFLGAGVLILVKQQLFVDYFRSFLQDLSQYNSEQFRLLEEMWGCCGVSTPDFSCVLMSKTPTPTCFDVLELICHYLGKYVAGGHFAVAGLELISIGMSLCVANSLRYEDKY